MYLNFLTIVPKTNDPLKLNPIAVMIAIIKIHSSVHPGPGPAPAPAHRTTLNRKRTLGVEWMRSDAGYDFHPGNLLYIGGSVDRWYQLKGI